MAKNNQDAYRRGGRNGNGAAYRKQQAQSGGKQQRGNHTERTRNTKAQQPHVPMMTAAEEAEAQLASLHGESQSVLDRLPKAVGPAGVPRSARPMPTAQVGETSRGPTRALAARDNVPAPASADAGNRNLSWLQERLVRAFPPLFRAAGLAARAVDRPVRDALDTLQWLGRAARRVS